MTHRTFPRGASAVLTAMLAALLTGCLERELKPLNPCLVSGVVAEVAVSNIEKVDLLFMVDNSISMKDEQDALAREFPNLITALATGDRDLDGVRDFTPVKDLHLGVVSSDMGLANITLPMSGCMGVGDDGRLQNTAATSVVGCSSSTYSPPYLIYDQARGDDPTQLAVDFSCIATLGTDGCGFEQQLESALKAVWPGSDPSRKFLTDAITGSTSTGNGGSGFANGEFIREDSLIAIVIVTDEEDCSSKSMEHFVANTGTGLNTRCFHEGQKPGDNGLFSVQRYIDSFKALRPGRENLVIFAGIVGVPERLVKKEVMAAYDFKDRAQSDAFFDSLLSDPEMQAQIDDRGTPDDPNDDNLRSSCSVPGVENSNAYPPRRIVEVAKGFGANGVIQSICQDDFGPAMDAIIKAIAEQLPDVCLPRPLVVNSDGLVECNVIWELPREPNGRAPTRCDERTYLAPPDSNRSEIGENGGAACKMTQLPVIGMTAPSGTDGWFYDDFSDDTLEQCRLYPDQQRITFTLGATPPTGVLVKLECLNETQALPNTRTDLQRDAEQPAVGDGCDRVMLRGREVSNDDACVVLLAEPVNGSTEDRGMFCHAESRVCVQRCATSADCPAAWVCDDRPDTIAAAGGAHCLNPTCGGGGD